MSQTTSGFARSPSGGILPLPFFDDVEEIAVRYVFSVMPGRDSREFQLHTRSHITIAIGRPCRGTWHNHIHTFFN